jgi:membrane-bound PQQ-dependent dehydrogenase (glucose/quinate/shikimate family)
MSLFALRVIATGIACAGLILLPLGALLARHGGSPFYLATGMILSVVAVGLFLRRGWALHLLALTFVGTWIWAVAEVGLDGWALLPRVDMISVLLLLCSLPFVRSLLHRSKQKTPAFLAKAYAPVGLLSLVVIVVLLNSYQAGDVARTPDEAPRTDGTASHDWPYVGQNAGGTRFSSLSTINSKNVSQLRRIWDHVEPRAPSRTGPPFKDEATPLQVGDKLFACLADNTVIALDAEEGRLRWRYDPHSDLAGVKAAVCRGVAYYADATSSECPTRILTATLDARLIALNAETGTPCKDFGKDGQVSLKTGMGSFEPGMYYVTSPPTISHGMAIVGGLVQDDVSIGEPSGVVRAYDARSGKLAWAWDLGRRPDDKTGERSSSEPYTPGTPNAWSLFSSDDALGLIYIPTGNATPDFVGSHRKSSWEKYSSSVVALDVATGQVRWSFQLVHHDLWDYDASAQPILADMPSPDGLKPALIEATKQGDIFVLDRRTGAPLSPVVEKPVPQTDVPHERTSPTQPFSIGMPNLSGPRLREADMWGLTPIDQAWCRLKFRRLRYDGVFTPPSLGGSIQYPGTAGGTNWGSMSVDNTRHLLFVPSFRLASMSKLIPRDLAKDNPSFTYPQSGTPYLADSEFFLTRLGVPCQRPPYGLLTAIDLRSKAIVWNRAIGTAEDLGPLGIASHLPFTIGAAPVVGGAISTAGGLVFIGAAGDRRLRAIDSQSGRELWSDKLPQGNQATPITYRAPRSGRQIVAFVSGGYADLRHGKNVPVHVVAYALPR